MMGMNLHVDCNHFNLQRVYQMRKILNCELGKVDEDVF